MKACLNVIARQYLYDFTLRDPRYVVVLVRGRSSVPGYRCGLGLNDSGGQQCYFESIVDHFRAAEFSPTKIGKNFSVDKTIVAKTLLCFCLDIIIALIRGSRIICSCCVAPMF